MDRSNILPYFPEDLGLAEYIHKHLDENGVFKDNFGRGQEAIKVELTNNWLKRKRSFAEDVYGVRMNVLERLPVDQEQFSREEVFKAVTEMGAETMMLVAGSGTPTDDKYLLQNYTMQVVNVDGEVSIVDDVRSTKISVAEYWNLVNN